MSYQMETNKDSKAFTPAAQSRAVFGYDRVIEGITLHWWGEPSQNPQFDSIVNYLCRDGGNTSAHYVATGTGRRVSCIVAPTDVAWHSGNAWGNARTVGIELDPRNRPEDRDVLAELIADIRSAFGDVPLYWHNYFVATTCPGVYRDIIEELDALSYTKFSAPINWGEGGDINPKTPPPVVVEPPVVTPPAKSLYKLLVNGKQVAAYSTDINAYSGYVVYGKTGIIKLDGTDVTAEIVHKFTAPSPTTQDPSTGEPLPDTGVPVIDKHDYSEENNNLIKQILTLLQGLIAKLTGIFK